MSRAFDFRQLLALLLIGANAALVHRLMRKEPMMALSRSEPNGPELGQTPQIPGARPFGEFSLVYDKTLFRPDRRPFVPRPPAPPPPVQAQPAAPAPPPDPMLIAGGIVVGEKKRVVFLVDRNTGQGSWANEGDVIAGWTVAQVTETTVTLTSGGRQIELRMYGSD